MPEITPAPSVTEAIPEKLTNQQALQVLVDAARLAQSKGVYTFDEAEIINKAIKTFMVPVGPQPS